MYFKNKRCHLIFPSGIDWQVKGYMRGEIHTEHEAPESWCLSLSLTPEFLCSSAEQVQSLDPRPGVVDPVEKISISLYPLYEWMSADRSNETSRWTEHTAHTYLHCLLSFRFFVHCWLQTSLKWSNFFILILNPDTNRKLKYLITQEIASASIMSHFMSVLKQ